jgi:hypothetical protein
LTPVSSTALGGDTKSPKFRSKSGGYFRTQKYTLPNNQPSFFLAKNRQMTTPPQISGDIPRFSLKEFIKVRPWRGGGVCGVAPQVWRHQNKKKHCPANQPSFVIGEKSTLP